MPRRDPEAFAEFVTARSPALHRTAYLLVGERGLAHDLLQEALIKTYLAWPRLRDPGRAEAYTRKAITTTAISWYRRKGWSAERPGVAPPDVGRPGHEAAVTERDWLWHALMSLPPRQRAALVCRFYEDLSEAQTAELMGCAPGTVKSQVSAGLRKLRALVAERGHDIPSLETDLLEAKR